MSANWLERRTSACVFCLLEFLFTANFCRPGVGQGPIISLHQQLTKTWIPALDGKPIQDTGTTGFLEVLLLRYGNTLPDRAFTIDTSPR